MRTHGLDRALALRAAAGDLVVGGASTGGMCWFNAGFTMSFGPLGPLHDGLGWLPGSFNPHAAQPGRLEAFEAAIAHLTLPPGWAVDDGAALHFVDGHLHRVVHAAPGAHVHKVAPHGVRAVECESIG